MLRLSVILTAGGISDKSQNVIKEDNQYEN